MLQEERRLLVCCSRTITDKNWIYSQIESYWYENLACYSDPIMIEGAAREIDLIAKAYAVENDWEIEEYPADKNIMVKKADEVLILWDRDSKDTKHYIDLCKKYNKPHKIVLYKEE